MDELIRILFKGFVAGRKHFVFILCPLSYLHCTEAESQQRDGDPQKGKP